MKRRDRRSDCPMNYTVQALGDAWSLLVVRDVIFRGKRTFSEFAASEERISTNILADRLRALTSEGILRKVGAGRSTRYSLTEKGLDLLPLLVEMLLWGSRYDPDTGVPRELLRQARDDREGLIASMRAKLRAEHGISRLEPTTPERRPG